MSYCFLILSELLTGMYENGLRMARAQPAKSRAGPRPGLLKRPGSAAFLKPHARPMSALSKPAPDMLEELSIETGVPCERMVMIGDTGFDLLMAKKATRRWWASPYGAKPEGPVAGAVAGIGRQCR